MGTAQVILLCGRVRLLHRDMGRWHSSCPALIIRLICIVLQSVTARKRFFGLYTVRAAFFVVQRVAVLVVGSWVARHGRGRGAFRWVGARRGIRWVPLHSNPPLEADGDLPPCPRWDCCRFHACGRRMVEDYTAAGRMPSCIKYIVFICAFCAKSPLVRMRSPVQIWVAAPENT